MKGWEELRGMFRPESSDFKDSGMGGRRETLRRRAAGEEGTQRWKGRMDAVTWVKTHHDFYTLFHFYGIFPPSKKKGQNTLSKIQLLPDPHSSSGFTVLLKSMSKYFWKVWAFSFAWCVVLCLLIQLCPTLCGPMDCSLPGSSIHGDSPGKNTRVDCHDLLQGIFPTQGLNPGLPHCRQILYHLNHQGNPSPVQWHINRHKYFWGRQGGKFTEHTCSISRTWLLRHFPFPVNRGYGSVTWLGFRATIQPSNPIPGHISRENHNS